MRSVGIAIGIGSGLWVGDGGWWRVEWSGEWRKGGRYLQIGKKRLPRLVYVGYEELEEEKGKGTRMEICFVLLTDRLCI
jgi:hypothetical protein